MSKEGLSRRDFLSVTGALAGAGLVGGNASGEKPTAGANNGGGLGPGPVEISLRVNGEPRKLTVEPRTTLLDALRDPLELTGAKRACDRGECGACTVLLDGRSVYACMVLALQARDRDIRTVEGLSSGDSLHPVQQAFIDCDGYQCGFCTPGQVVSTVALLGKTPDPTLDQVKEGLSGNLCRCAAYNKIFEAAMLAAKKR